MIALNIAGGRERLESLVTVAVAEGRAVRENSASVHMCLVLQECIRNRHLLLITLTSANGTLTMNHVG